MLGSLCLHRHVRSSFLISVWCFPLLFSLRVIHCKTQCTQKQTDTVHWLCNPKHKHLKRLLLSVMFSRGAVCSDPLIGLTLAPTVKPHWAGCCRAGFLTAPQNNNTLVNSNLCANSSDLSPSREMLHCLEMFDLNPKMFWKCINVWTGKVQQQQQGGSVKLFQSLCAAEEKKQ